MPRITIEQKLRLRSWYNSQQNKPSQSEAIIWFKREYDVTLPQYQISRILHSKNLETVDQNSPGLQNTRVVKAVWPALEQILKRWQISLEVRGLSTSREVLMQKARDIWLQYPIARNNEPVSDLPVFGATWCNLFQKRFSLNSFALRDGGDPDEAGGNLPDMKSKMARLVGIVSRTPAGNRYNMDQTGLYWRRSASSGVPLQQRAGAQLSKTRISIAITTNDTGDDRVDLWIIGKAAMPRALKDFNWKGYRTVWKHNQKAWFTTATMAEWLKAFYSHIQATKPGQNVLLLLRNKPDTLAAVKETPPPANITIEFFPGNVATIYQPNEMGVINILKSYYRRSFLLWLYERTLNETSEDPMSQMNLRLAIVWISDHWFSTVTQEAIVKCWLKSTLLGPPPTDCRRVQEPPKDLGAIYSKATAHIEDRMAMTAFLTPKDENTPPDEPCTALGVLDQVLEDWCPRDDYRDIEEVTEEANQPETVPITLREGLLNLTQLMTLVESNQAFDSSDIHRVQHLKDTIIKSLQGRTE
ncbi:putative DUF1275 domain protein [Rosellinia necatrix]|uniref:Putative DUF1275 domain protein n=1 Tax=Rosellinia necatrix TaxID=77044 RepID=A0A1W2TXF0_ROSNE|nr:putative DUF1275 domain protein [Rosellinia necatrix]